MAITKLDDIFDKAPSTGGRATTAILEVKDMLFKWLAPTLDRVNSENRLQIPKPKGYYIAGSDIKSDWPNIIVGFSVASSPMTGLGRIDQDHISIAVYCAYHRIESQVQLLNCLETCYWIRNIIMCNRGAHCNAEGLPCWKGIESQGINPSPQAFPNFQGMAYQFRAWQPGDMRKERNYWKAGE